MSFRFDKEEDEHADHKEDEKEDDLSFVVLPLVSRCLSLGYISVNP